MREDGWLSERFGHPVYSLTGLEGGFDAEALRGHTTGRDAASYQAKVAAGAWALVRDLVAAGFREVCTAVTLARALEPPLDPRRDEPVVRPIDPDRDSGLPDLAARAFHSSRFHLDPYIPGSVATAIKRDWTASYLSGTRGVGALVAEGDHGPLGFLGMLGTGDVRVIDLIAVDPAGQGRGAGRALVRRLLDETCGHSERVEVGTQTANGRAIRFYERLGFATARTAHDLHLHTGTPRWG
ncbi:MAG: GNAT family N-acetyltransferase [Thermoleophilaceae bacterium]